ncbi:Uncharacterised protein [Klebsiella pneumoniae subsp. ozaenae]|uniref:Uncharacterized protein n=1 Tax=Klebsiella pneumoniae subsp. ozaenae TaxID=574 RepID=A0A378B937_KLEPO|nr:Uncharacterised protein [Klebsiella pneumoniae subsp. ozaenae]
MDGRTIGRLTEVITCSGVAPTVRAASSTVGADAAQRRRDIEIGMRNVS